MLDNYNFYILRFVPKKMNFIRLLSKLLLIFTKGGTNNINKS